MPLPKPRRQEQRKNFIKRCMGANIMKREYPDNDQRMAVCSTQWRNNIMLNELKAIRIKTNFSIPARQEVLNGEQYTVYPVVMIREGVMNNILYSKDNFTNAAYTWNGTPVTIQHPVDDGKPISANNPQVYDTQVVGTIFNTHIDGDALKAEIWLRNRSLNNIAPEIKQALENNYQIDVSTGLTCDEVFQNGEFKGAEYNSIATNIRPDHLALLPDQTGACSWEDGCGVRQNKMKGGGTMNRGNRKENIDNNQKDSTKYLLINESDLTETVKLVSRKLDSMDVQNEKYNYPIKIYESKVIYRVEYIGNEVLSKFYERSYSINEDGGVEWESDPVEVVEHVEYRQKQNERKENKMEVKTMKECCPDKVDELIANNENFTDDNKDDLLAMTEDQFAMVINVSKPVEKEEHDQEPDTKQNDDKDNKGDEKELSFNELLEKADPETRESVQYGQRLLANQKKDFVARILENESNQFSETELNEIGFDMLEKLAYSIPGKPKQVANFGLRNPAKDEDFIDNEDVPEPLPINNCFGQKEEKAS